MNTEFDSDFSSEAHQSRGDIRSEFTSEFFDSCSRAWLANKKRSGEGSYRYVCGVETCSNRVRGDEVNCRFHKGRGLELNRPAPDPKGQKAPEQTKKQEIDSRADRAQRRHTGGSPTEQQDLSVADRVARRRRSSPSQ